MKQLEFIASIPDLQSAFSGPNERGGTTRMKLDIPAHSADQANALIQLQFGEYRGSVLKVTMEIVE